MNTDRTITDVAKDMTTLTRHPDVRRRVMASIDGVTRETPRAWVVAAWAGAAIACVTVVALSISSSLPTDRSPARAVISPAPAPTAAVIGPGTAGDAADVPLRGLVAPPSRGVATAERPMAVAAATDEFRPLPLLAPPPAIAVDPVMWDAVMIAPLDVAAIEVSAVAIEPLLLDDGNGV